MSLRVGLLSSKIIFLGVTESVLARLRAGEDLFGDKLSLT